MQEQTAGRALLSRPFYVTRILPSSLLYSPPVIDIPGDENCRRLSISDKSVYSLNNASNSSRRTGSLVPPRLLLTRVPEESIMKVCGIPRTPYMFATVNGSS